MSKYFEDLVSNEPVERTVEHDGKSKTVWFRKINAGERLKLARGQRVTLGDQNTSKTEIDIGDLTTRQHMLVQFSVVDENGKNVFQNVTDVQKLPNQLVDKLYQFAEDVNREELPAGKS